MSARKKDSKSKSKSSQSTNIDSQNEVVSELLTKSQFHRQLEFTKSVLEEIDLVGNEANYKLDQKRAEAVYNIHSIYEGMPSKFKKGFSEYHLFVEGLGLSSTTRGEILITLHLDPERLRKKYDIPEGQVITMETIDAKMKEIENYEFPFADLIRKPENVADLKRYLAKVDASLEKKRLAREKAIATAKAKREEGQKDDFVIKDEDDEADGEEEDDDDYKPKSEDGAGDLDSGEGAGSGEDEEVKGVYDDINLDAYPLVPTSVKDAILSGDIRGAFEILQSEFQELGRQASVDLDLDDLSRSVGSFSLEEEQPVYDQVVDDDDVVIVPSGADGRTFRASKYDGKFGRFKGTWKFSENGSWIVVASATIISTLESILNSKTDDDTKME